MRTLVLGTVVAQSNLSAWIGIVGLAFDGFRLHAMDYAGWHHVINRQNFAAQVANQVLGVEVLPAIGAARGLAFDGKQFWTINRDPNPDLLLCYKLEDAVNPQLIKSFALRADSTYAGVTFDGKNLVAARDSRIEFWNPQTEALIRTFAPGFFPRDLAFDGKYLWACDTTNDLVHCINPVTGIEVTNFAFPPAPDNNPSGIGFDGKYLWIGTYTNLGLWGTIYCVEKS